MTIAAAVRPTDSPAGYRTIIRRGARRSTKTQHLVLARHQRYYMWANGGRGRGCVRAALPTTVVPNQHHLRMDQALVHRDGSR